MEYLKIAQDLEMYGVNYFEIKNKKATELMARMNTDMDQLAKAEEALQQMQRKLSLKESKIESLSSTPMKFCILSFWQARSVLALGT